MEIEFKKVDIKDDAHYAQAIEVAKEIFGPNSESEITFVFKMKKPVMHLALSNKEVVGFKAGFEDRPYRFYSSSGGVLQDFRNKGVASKLMQQQHEWCKSEGYAAVWTETKNKFVQMISLNLKNGMQIIGTYVDHRNEPKIILEKKLL